MNLIIYFIFLAQTQFHAPENKANKWNLIQSSLPHWRPLEKINPDMDWFCWWLEAFSHHGTIDHRNIEFNAFGVFGACCVIILYINIIYHNFNQSNSSSWSMHPQKLTLCWPKRWIYLFTYIEFRGTTMKFKSSGRLYGWWWYHESEEIMNLAYMMEGSNIERVEHWINRLNDNERQ